MEKQQVGVIPSQKGMGGAERGEGTVTIEGVRFRGPSCPTIQREINRCPCHSPELTRVVPIPTPQTREIPTERGTTTTRRLSLSRNVEQTGMSSTDSMVRQRTPFGDPLNDEQRSDNLLAGPLSHYNWPGDCGRGKVQT